MHNDRATIDLRNESHGDTSHPPYRPRWPFVLLGAIFFVGAVACIRVAQAPEFPGELILEIPTGYSVRDIGHLLREKRIIRSSALFTLVIDWSGKASVIRSGTYVFKEPMNVFRVARRFAEGDFGITRTKITFPEGITVRNVLEIASKVLPHVNVAEAAALAHKEGYLFPDTYFFFTTATTGAVIASMEENFLKRTVDLRERAIQEGKRWEEIVTMASLIEREVATDPDRAIVSGILWKRLRIGMPLQVDATFMYLLGKTSEELTVEDLNIDSPYNTYRNRGLPPSPIANPGRAALLAALTPEESPYFYYLSDASGTIHYAKTFEEHKANRKKYLK